MVHRAIDAKRRDAGRDEHGLDELAVLPRGDEDHGLLVTRDHLAEEEEEDAKLLLVTALEKGEAEVFAWEVGGAGGQRDSGTDRRRVSNMTVKHASDTRREEKRDALILVSESRRTTTGSASPAWANSMSCLGIVAEKRSVCRDVETCLRISLSLGRGVVFSI